MRRAASRAEQPTTIGAFYKINAVPATSAPLVFGSRVVGEALIPQLIRHSKMDRCVLLTSPFDRAAASRRMAQLLDDERTSIRSVEVHSTTSLLRDSSWLDVTAWHEVGDVWQFPCELRTARARKPYPITATHHTFSYRDQLHDFYRRMLLLDIRPYDALICTTSTARRALTRVLEHVTSAFNRAHGARLRYRGRMETIPLGVDTQRFRPMDKAPLRAELGLPEDALILLWFGRLSFMDKADLLPLLSVYRDLLHDNPASKLLLVLAGSSVARAAEILARRCADLGVTDHVRILSPFQREDREALFAAADIFVAPGDNIQEAFGQTPVEAMACGVPQVVSDWDGYRDTVAHGETGFLVPTYWARCDRDLIDTPILAWDLVDHGLLAQSVAVDLAQLKAHLRDLIRNEDLRARLGRASRRRAVEVFDWKVVMAQYDALWLDLAEAARRSRFKPDPRVANLNMPYFDAFRGYPTRLLAEATAIRLTAAGRRALRGEDAVPGYVYATMQSLEGDVLSDALAALDDDGPVTFGALARRIARPGAHRDYARRHVLWLLKYGFAEIAGPRGGATSGRRAARGT